MLPLTAIVVASAERTKENNHHMIVQPVKMTSLNLSRLRGEISDRKTEENFTLLRFRRQ